MHTPEPIQGTVLIIDTVDRLPQEKALLEEAGLHVISATSTEQGLKMARAQQPDLVISEVMLEKPDAGFVLSYRMKSDPELKSVPLMLLSSIFAQTGTVFDLNSPSARQWIKADVYLERPIADDRLVARVRGMLQNRVGVHKSD